MRNNDHMCIVASEAGGSNKGAARGIMVVSKVGSMTEVPMKMTLMSDGRITGTFGSGSVSGSSDSFKCAPLFAALTEAVKANGPMLVKKANGVAW